MSINNFETNDQSSRFILYEESFNKFINHIQNSWYQGILWRNREVWERFYSSKYTIEDAYESIKDFYYGVGFENYKDGYLKIYGVFQALYLIQDTLNNLYNIVFDTRKDQSIEKNFGAKYKNLLEVRYLRNRISGHPSKNQYGENIYISRITISGFSFQVQKCFPNKEEYKKKTEFSIINLKAQIEMQIIDMLQIMTEIEFKVKTDINNHKLRNNKLKLSDGFSNMNYYFQKSFSMFFKNDDFEFGESCYISIKKNYNKKYSELKLRLESLEFVEHFSINNDEIQFLFSRIDNHINKKRILDDIEGRIFLRALQELIEGFKDSLTEIDRNYAELIE